MVSWRVWLCGLASLFCGKVDDGTDYRYGNDGNVDMMLPAQLHDTVMYEWVVLDYEWPNAIARSQAILDGTFIPKNNIITGVKTYNNDIYVTVPRWLPGVPSTLNVITTNSSGANVLSPYPSWEMQMVGNNTALQYVQSMEIDVNGRMWILDVGRLNLETDTPTVGVPKLVIYDMVAEAVERTYVFPNDVAPYDSSFLNDIVVDTVNGFAYMTDTGSVGALVVYDYTNDRSRRVLAKQPSTQHMPSGHLFPYNGAIVNNTNNADGIALSADGSTLFYCALGALDLYSIETRYLMDWDMDDAALAAQVTLVGAKASFTDGMAIDENNVLYYGALSDDSVVAWTIGAQALANASILVQDNSTILWADTFAFDGNGNLLFTTGNLPVFLSGEMDFSGASGSNFRVHSIPVQADSYMHGPPVRQSLPPTVPAFWFFLAVAGLAAVVVLLIATAGMCIRLRQRSARRSNYLPVQ